MQTIGRARGMWRTERDPVDIGIWTDVPLQDFQGPNEAPYDIGELVEPILWDEIKPGREEMMIAHGGVWLQSAKDAETAYPGVDGGSLKKNE
jgi:hypothetical protein